MWGWQPVDDDSVLWYAAGPTGGHVYGVPEKVDTFKEQDQAYNNFKALPNGLFYWKSDFDAGNVVLSGRELNTPIVRPLLEKVSSYAWSEGTRHTLPNFVSYHNSHPRTPGVWGWGREAYVALAAAPVLPDPLAPATILTVPGVGCLVNNHLKRDNFFKYVMGMTEDEFLRKPTPSPIPARFHAGTFEQISVGMLKSNNDRGMHADGVMTPVVGDRPYFNVIICTGDPDDPAIKDLRKYADIGALQARPENCGAVFQIASRFHTLEGRAIRGFGPKAKAWDTLTHFVGGTQGEEAAISAAPGVIHRMYFLTDEINLLSGLGIKLNNIGMPDDPGTPSLNPPETNLQTMQRLGNGPLGVILANYNVGIQKDVQVISGLAHVHAVPGLSKEEIKDGERKRRGCNMLEHNPEQRVHQVLTAALNLSHNRPYGDLAEREKPALFAQNIIQAGYEGTLRAAVYLGTPKVFLTLVGGGAFRNPLEWISGAIMVQKDFIRAHNINVTLVFYKTSDVRFEPALKNLSKEIGGWVVEVGAGILPSVLEYPHPGAVGVIKTLQDWENFQSTHPAKQTASPKLERLQQSLTGLKTKLGLLAGKLRVLKG